MECLIEKYTQCEQEVSDAIRDSRLTKELCQKFLRVSDCMFALTEKVNPLARAAVRHRLALMCMEDGDKEHAIAILEDLVEELVKTTNRFGYNEDWTEYIIGVSELLFDHFIGEKDTERANMYARIIEKAKQASAR